MSMINLQQTAQRIFEKYPCRFKDKEKTAFIDEIKEQVTAMGYSDDEIRIISHKGINSGRNIVIGDPLKAKRFITAHYDTPGRNGFIFASSKLVGQTGANIIFIVMLLPILYVLGLASKLLGNIFTDGIGIIIASFLPAILYLLFFMSIMMIKNPSNRNDNTSGVLAALSCADRLSDKVKDGRVCVVLFDNEEWGLVGSSHFASWLKKQGVDLKERTVINLDCVGVGDTLVAATTGKPKYGTVEFLDKLELPSLGTDEDYAARSFLPQDRNGRIVRKKSQVIYMSDHASFPDSLMLSTMLKSKIGLLYMPSIHTAKDTECDVDMVEKLSERVVDAVNSLIGQDDGSTR